MLQICQVVDLPTVPEVFIEENNNAVYERLGLPMIQNLQVPDLKNKKEETGQTKLIHHTDESKKQSYDLDNNPRLIDWDDGSKKRICTIRRYPFSNQLYAWVKENIYPWVDDMNHYQLGHQVWKQGDVIWPHTDGVRGHFVLSYLLEEGGDFVETVWYKVRDKEAVLPPATHYVNFNNIDVVTRKRLPLGKWVLNDARILHSVYYMTQPRIAITIGLMKHEVIRLIEHHNIDFGLEP
jgi:hypothetical protein